MKNKVFAVLAACAVLAARVSADDFDDFGDFGDFGGSDDSGGFGDFGDFGGFGSSSSSSPSVSISGSAELSGRVYVDLRKDGSDGDRYSVGDFKTEGDPSARIDFDYSGAVSDISVKLKFDANSLGDYKEDILDEFTARAYLGSFQLEAGKMKTVWGKGDKLHVLDNFNANDYTDFLIPDYIDRRVSEPMFRAVYTTPSNLKLEGIVTPGMTADRYATEGVWYPEAMTTMTSLVTSAVSANAAAALSSGDTAAALSYASFDSDDLYADTHKLKYAQAGLRATFTVGHWDLGASYYYGHYKQVSADLEKYVNSVAAGSDYIDLPELKYDRLQVFGLEAAAVIWKLNTRFEAAYNLTDDIAGDDPWVHNNSIAWIAGFDIDLPVSNLNFNIQTQGSYILRSNEIGGSYKAYDVDYDSCGHYTNNRIVILLSDSYNHEKIEPEIKFVWGIEHFDFLIIPSITIKAADDFSICASGLWIYAEDEQSEFHGWRRNSFAEIACKYMF